MPAQRLGPLPPWLYRGSLQNLPPYSPKAVIARATHRPQVGGAEKESSFRSGDVNLLHQRQHLGADPCPALLLPGMWIWARPARNHCVQPFQVVCVEGIQSPSATQGAIPGLEVHRTPPARMDGRCQLLLGTLRYGVNASIQHTSIRVDYVLNLPFWPHPDAQLAHSVFAQRLTPWQKKPSSSSCGWTETSLALRESRHPSA